MKERGRQICALRYDKIAPGDVLLTRGRGYEAFSTAHITAPRSLKSHLRGAGFSHAGIWLPYVSPAIYNIVPEQIWVHLAESNDAGVASGRHLLTNVHTKDGQYIMVVPFFDTKSIILLRHPNLKHIHIDKLVEAADWLQKNHFHRAYPKLSRLVDAAHRYPHIQKLFARFAVDESDDSDVLVRGMFCSELVATFFERLGVPLFSPPRSPSSVAPNDLEESLLEEVQGAILEHSQINYEAMFADEDRLRAEKFSRDHWLVNMVSINSSNIRLMEASNRLIRHSNESIIKSKRHIADSHAITLKDCLASIALAENHVDVGLSRLQRYAEVLQLITEVDQIIWSGDADEIRRDASLSQAEQTKIEDENNDLFEKCARNYLRTSVLMGIRISNNGSRERNDRRRLEIRHALLRHWIRWRQADKAYGQLIAEIRVLRTELVKGNA